MKIFLNGLKFGMLLQMAIGPMCLLVFNTARNTGFITALTLVFAISLIDAFYITLSCFGASKMLNSSKYDKFFRLLGAFVLIFFGLNIIFSVFKINIVPGLNLKPTTRSVFIQGLILTLSNPMTIVFWTSVLTGKIIEDKLKKKQLIVFSFGLISASLIFLSLVAMLGTLFSTFISKDISNLLNIVVGVFIIFFGLKLGIKKR